MSQERLIDCGRCSKTQPGAAFRYYYESIQDLFVAYPEKRLIHLHFGFSTTSDELNIQEAKWIYDQYMDVYNSYPGIAFFTVADMIMPDDSESVPAESMEYYKKIINHPQSSIAVAYGMSIGFRMILHALIILTKQRKKIVFFRSAEDAEERYIAWREKQGL